MYPVKDIETDENIEVVQPDYNDHEGSGVTCTQQLENGGRTTLRNEPRSRKLTFL